MKKPPSKPPARVYPRGRNPASMRTRFGPGGRPPKRDFGPEPPEDTKDVAKGEPWRSMVWVIVHEDHWDRTEMRRAMRKWKNKKPNQFWKYLGKLREEAALQQMYGSPTRRRV